MFAGLHVVSTRRWARSLLMGVLASAAALLAFLVWTTTASHAASAPPASGSFAVTGVTATSAGTAQTVQVTALNSQGKPNAGYRGSVLLTSTDAQATLPAAYMFTKTDKGVHSFTVILRTAGTQKVMVTDSQAAVMTGSLTTTVASGPAATLTVSGLGDATAGTAQGVTLTARDAFANIATGYRGTVHVTSSDPQASLPSDASFTAADAGSRVLVVKLKTAGAQTVTFADASDASVSVTTQPVAIASGPAATLRLGTDLTQSYGQNRLTTAGQRFTVTITAVDAYGNTAADYAGTVRLSSSDGATPLNGGFGSTTLQFDASDAGTVTLTGVAFFTKKIYGDAASLTAVDAGDTRMTAGATFTVLPGPAVRYAACAPALTKASGYQVQSASIGVNDDLGLPFTALDAYGNDATNREPLNPLIAPLPRGYEAQATVTTTDAQAANIVGATFTGSRLWVGPPVDITLRTAGVQTVTITDTGHQDPSGQNLTLTCSYSVHGPRAFSGTVDIADPQTSGNTVNFLPASSFLPPDDQDATVDALSGPYVGDAISGYDLLGAVSAADGFLGIRWDLDPAVVPDGMRTCDTTHICAVPGPKQITYRLRDQFGNTSVGLITLSPWNVAVGVPIGNIVYSGESVQVSPNQVLALGTQHQATVVSAADGKVTVQTSEGVAMTIVNPAGSGLTAGMAVTVRVDQPLNVGGQEALGGCIPSGGLYCPVPSFAAVTVIPVSTSGEVDPNNQKILVSQGYDACVLPDLMTECPTLTFVGASPDGVTSGPPDAAVRTPYSYAFDVVESPAGETVSFTLSGLNPLPPGLSLSSAGVLQGTPTAAGTYVFFVEARGMTSNSTANARVVLTVK